MGHSHHCSITHGSAIMEPGSQPIEDRVQIPRGVPEKNASEVLLADGRRTPGVLVEVGKVKRK